MEADPSPLLECSFQEWGLGRPPRNEAKRDMSREERHISYTPG